MLSVSNILHRDDTPISTDIVHNERMYVYTLFAVYAKNEMQTHAPLCHCKMPNFSSVEFVNYFSVVVSAI